MGSLTVTITDVNGQTRSFGDVAEGMSVMEVAKANGVDGMFADCGGGCSCATCHVYVAEGWMARAGLPDDIEADMLDMAANPLPNSRLSCQIKLNGALDGLEVTVAPA